MPVVKFKVKCDAGQYGVKIDKKDLVLVDGEGEMNLASIEEHKLVWFMAGAVGSTFNLVGKSGLKDVVIVKDKKIPSNQGDAGDYALFSI